MAKLQSWINVIPSQRARRGVRGVLSQFLNDDDPTTFKTFTFGNVAAGADSLVWTDGFLGHTIRTGTYQSTADGGVTLTSTNDYNAAFLADDSGANIGASVRNLLGRTLLTFDQSGGSIRSVMGQLKLLTGIDVATGVYTAVQGYLELVATHAVSSGATLSGMDVSIELGGTVTVASGGVLAGIRIETTGAGTLAGAGEIAAIYIEDSGTVTDWKVGIDINNCTTGIDIGACTAGINISGAGAVGISINTSTPTNGILISAACATTGILLSGANATSIGISGANTSTSMLISGTWGSSANYGAITIAGDAAGTALALGASATSFLGMRIDLTAAVTAGNDFMAIHSELETSGAMVDGFIIGMYQRVRIAHVAYENYAIWGRMDVNVAQTGDTANQFIGVFGSVGFAAGAHALLATGGGYGVQGTASIATGGTIDQPLIGGYFEANAVDTQGATLVTASRHRMLGYCNYGVDVLTQTSNGVAGIRIRTQDAAKLSDGIRFEASTDGGVSKINHAFNFTAADQSDGASVAASTIDNLNADGVIKIDCAGTDYYIPFWDAGAISTEWADVDA